MNRALAGAAFLVAGAALVVALAGRSGPAPRATEAPVLERRIADLESRLKALRRRLDSAPPPSDPKRAVGVRGPDVDAPAPQPQATPRVAEASFRAFDRRASAGERLTVVFHGASLTWGSNATDPNLTSYRAGVAEHLERKYPEAHFTFYDSGIGGPGSQLGIFRLDRDVLRRRPDLVLVDFTANDDIYSADPERCASYEAIVRRIILEASCPVVIVVFPFRWNAAQGNTGGMKGRDAHIAIARAYSVPVGDALVLCQERVKKGEATLEKIWPVGPVHPGDYGYGLFAEAAFVAYEKALSERVVCKAPAKMLHAATYMTTARVRISTLGRLPKGWRVGRANRTSAWYDALMSRWLDDVAIAANRTKEADAGGEMRAVPQEVAPLEVRFRGAAVLLFGESTLKSGKYRIHIDGRKADEYDASSKKYGGNTHLTQMVADGLDPKVEHTLEIEPVFRDDVEQELRLESICVAGPGAKVWRAE